MSTKFFTNRDGNTLIDKFEGIFTYNRDIACFDALVGYLRSTGYFKLRPFLEKVKDIRILVGINVDSIMVNFQKKGLEFLGDKSVTKDEFISKLKEDVAKSNYNKDIEEGVIQFVNDIINEKVKVKAHPSKKIHAKVYIFRPIPFNPHTPASVITGSSNLTDAGLGSGDKHNYEFNVQLNDYQDVLFATDEFELLWKEAVDILPADVRNLLKETYLNAEITPFELYIKMLIEYFGSNIKYDPDSIGDLPENFKKLSYQVDAVNQGFDMMMKHNGFILADVVGLGKTVVAAMVAKRFLIANGRDYTKILVVYPPAVEKNWKQTFKQFDIDRYTKFISNGSLDKILNGSDDYWNKEDYDLVIVDESHKFRTHTTGIFQKLQLICKSPRRGDGFIEGFQKKVVLVSATPLNNRPDDIYYQIQMFQDQRQSTLAVTNLTAFFSPLIDEYKKIKRQETLDINKLRRLYGKIRDNIIQPITVRRTRRDLKNNKVYIDDIISQGIKFPEVKKPFKLEYVLNDELNELFSKTVNALIDELSYSRYQAIAGLKLHIPSLDRDRDEIYEQAELVSKSLAFIMKTQMIKRLESSFKAFKYTLSNFRNSTEKMIEMFKKDKVFIAPDDDVNSLIDKGLSDEEIEEIVKILSEENPKNNVFKASDFDDSFIEDLKKDYDILNELYEGWASIGEYDPKKDKFVDSFNNYFFHPDENISGKLVIFSESKVTIDYIANEIKKLGRNDYIVITGENRKKLHNVIMENFDANIDEQNQKNDYNIVLSTEVLAEGINLHRANVVVHYDTPWNSTKLMQRIGRVNRIGTKAENIYSYVFYPSAQGDAQIKLNKTAFTKIQAFHTAFGEDYQIYTEEEILDEFKLFNEDIHEEEDERLKYLFFLRKFFDEKKLEFNRIKALPLKSRTGRDSEKINRAELKNSTVTFLKNDRKFEFYHIKDVGKCEEITALAAMKIFEAKNNEARTELINDHYLHVQEALTKFEDITKQDFIDTEKLSASGRISQQTKKFLRDVSLNPLVTSEQKENFGYLIELINIGRFTNLANDIEKIRRKTEKNEIKITQCLKEIDKIYSKYVSEDKSLESNKSVYQKPVLILSESFK